MHFLNDAERDYLTISATADLLCESRRNPKSARRLMASVLVIRSPVVRTASVRGSTMSPESTQVSCSQHFRWRAIRRQ